MNENLVNKELKKYIEENIFKVYDLNKFSFIFPNNGTNPPALPEPVASLFSLLFFLFLLPWVSVDKYNESGDPI